jgi:PiT family inorganic phosphate transporter
VLISSGAVAYSIVNLLPVELVINVGSSAGFAMVFALLISAILWNLGTWYLGLPASSSHTLIGAILGVGLANSVMSGRTFGSGVNWEAAQKIGLALLISPVFGFLCAGLLLTLLKVLVKRPELYTEPPKGQAPPLWIRGLLVLTCTGVSYGHGSNDGQKGMGLIVLILVGILPATYALKLSETPEQLHLLTAQAGQAHSYYEAKAGDRKLELPEAVAEAGQFMRPGGLLSDQTFAALATLGTVVEKTVAPVSSLKEIPEGERAALRTELYLLSGATSKLLKGNKFTGPEEKKQAGELVKSLEAVTKFIPTWVKVAVAIALGLGTTIGWKRIVVTVGEKIGKSHLTYGQGGAAETVAACTILLADHFGMPVSTTHVLSSGVAGTMAFNGSGLQAQTLRNILLAWVLTLPVCIFLGSLLFAFGNFLVFRVLGLH